VKDFLLPDCFSAEVSEQSISLRGCSEIAESWLAEKNIYLPSCRLEKISQQKLNKFSS
jgi:hypothetical protein